MALSIQAGGLAWRIDLCLFYLYTCVKYWPANFEAWYGFLNSKGADALKVALKFALQQDWIDKIVVGVDSVSQLQALIEIQNSSERIDFPMLGCKDPNLINPSKWDLA